MKLAILGYGKMGKTIEKMAKERGNEVTLIINNHDELNQADWSKVDVAVEFSNPSVAFQNISTILKKGIPIVSGTTGWLDEKEKAEKLALENNTAFFYASNFSLGVNIFFKVNQILAEMMNANPLYDIEMEEIHHTEKLDSPSGTALTLADQIISKIDRKKNWTEHDGKSPEDLVIHAKRIENVPGTHTIMYQSDVDTIEIKHTAHNRAGFALGATMACEWIVGRKGIFNMNDLLNL